MITIPNADELKSQIAQLENLILENSGTISQHVIKIHQHALEKPECFALLSNEEVAILIKGIEKMGRNQILEGKKKVSIKKKYSDSDIDL